MRNLALINCNIFTFAHFQYTCKGVSELLLILLWEINILVRGWYLYIVHFVFCLRVYSQMLVIKLLRLVMFFPIPFSMVIYSFLIELVSVITVCIPFEVRSTSWLIVFLYYWRACETLPWFKSQNYTKRTSQRTVTPPSTQIPLSRSMKGVGSFKLVGILRNRTPKRWESRSYNWEKRVHDGESPL